MVFTDYGVSKILLSFNLAGDMLISIVGLFLIIKGLKITFTKKFDLRANSISISLERTFFKFLFLVVFKEVTCLKKQMEMPNFREENFLK